MMKEKPVRRALSVAAAAPAPNPTTGTTALVFDASALPAGAYLLRVVGETFTTTARVSVAR